MGKKGSTWGRFYKGRYLIAFYDAADDDTLVAVADNVKEMIDAYGFKRETVSTLLGRAFKGEKDHPTIKINGMKCIPHFIPMGKESVSWTSK